MALKFYRKIVERDLQTLLADVMVSFPELEDSMIMLMRTKFYGLQSSLRSYPPLLCLFWKKKKRIYPIVVNSNKRTAIPFDSVTYEEKQALLAHELGHTLYYINRNSLQLAWLSYALFPFSRYFNKKFEAYADIEAIYRGYGLGLLKYRKRVLKSSSLSHITYRKLTYMKPDEIEKVILSMPDLYPNYKLDKEIPSLEYDYVTKIYFFKRISTFLDHIVKTCLGYIPAIWGMVDLIWLKKIQRRLTYKKLDIFSAE